MRITYDAAKRQQTLDDRGLDFEDAALVMAGVHISGIDDRWDYGEHREIAVGYLHGRMVVIVFTERPTGRHVISMRKANGREQGRFSAALDRSG